MPRQRRSLLGRDHQMFNVCHAQCLLKLSFFCLPFAMAPQLTTILQHSGRPNPSRPSPPLQARNRRTQGNSTIPTLLRPSDSETPIRATCSRSRARLTSCRTGIRNPLAVACHSSASRSVRGFLGTFVRRYQPMRNPCEACHYHAKGYSTGASDSWSLGWARVKNAFFFSLLNFFLFLVGLSVRCLLGRGISCSWLHVSVRLRLREYLVETAGVFMVHGVKVEVIPRYSVLLPPFFFVYPLISCSYQC